MTISARVKSTAFYQSFGKALLPDVIERVVAHCGENHIDMNTVEYVNTSRIRVGEIKTGHYVYIDV